VASDVENIRASRPFDLYSEHQSGITEEEFRSLCSGSPIWHSVDLGDLFIEGARKNSTALLQELRFADLPDLRGKTVLDIGAFGGWYSFEAERRGASRVVALDYYSWAIDWQKLGPYQAAERAAGRIPNAYQLPDHVIDEVGQPGRSAFDATKKALGSAVEPVLGRVEEYDPGEPFDVVLFLGVLYHCEDPLGTLRKVASLTKDRLIVETAGVYVPACEDKAVWEFYGDDSANQDITTWWAPNDKALVDMLKAVGFDHVEIKSGAKRYRGVVHAALNPIRIWAHAWRDADS